MGCTCKHKEVYIYMGSSIPSSLQTSNSDDRTLASLDHTIGCGALYFDRPQPSFGGSRSTRPPYRVSSVLTSTWSIHGGSTLQIFPLHTVNGNSQQATPCPSQGSCRCLPWNQRQGYGLRYGTGKYSGTQTVLSWGVGQPLQDTDSLQAWSEVFK